MFLYMCQAALKMKFCLPKGFQEKCGIDRKF